MAQIRHDIVQPARPLTYDTEFEGLLRVGEASEVLAPSERGQAFRQILLSAEERTRVELWREYAPPAGASFSAAWRSSSDWFVGDDAGNLHVSRDAATWRVVHRFGGAVTGLYFDEEEESTLWVCTGEGEIWGARTQRRS